jgi:hypothetical protein
LPLSLNHHPSPQIKPVTIPQVPHFNLQFNHCHYHQLTSQFKPSMCFTTHGPVLLCLLQPAHSHRTHPPSLPTTAAALKSKEPTTGWRPREKENERKEEESVTTAAAIQPRFLCSVQALPLPP